MTTPLQIYVADLAAYNAGILHGTWIDLEAMDFDPDLVHEQIQTLLQASPVPCAEEFAIHDHEGFGDSIGEFSSILEVCQIGEFLEEHGDAARAALSVAVDLDEAKLLIENGYYVAESLADYALDFVDDMGIEIPSFLHIDWEATGRDLAMDMTQVVCGQTLYLFPA